MRKVSTKQILLLALGLGVLAYAAIILVHVSMSYEIGIQSILTPHVVGTPNFAEKDPQDSSGPRAGDRITRVGNRPIQTWSDLLQAPRILHHETESSSSADWYRVDPDTSRTLVAVEYCRPDEGATTYTAWFELRGLPLEEMIPSLIWLFLKGALFAIGAVVYWKRPDDESAMRFYLLCVVTLGAYMGGYHWERIIAEPYLMIVFMIFGTLLPVVSLHFYLVFPHKKPWLERYPYRTMAAVYGLPVLNLLWLIGFYGYIRWFADADSAMRQYVPWVIFLSFGISLIWYLACMATLFYSLRTAADETDRQQVRCIWIGVFFSHFPIAASFYIVFAEPERFAEGAVTWPMFGASLIVTIAFAVGMTRYRLMELDKIINSSMGYFLVSFLAGLMYYGVVFVGTLFYNRFVSSPTLPAALTVSTTALIFVLILDMARSRLQKALDRRFSRNKMQIDQTLEQMSHAVSQLVDPPVLAQRLVTTVADTLGVPSGAVYLRQGASQGFELAARHGGISGPDSLPKDSPLADALRSGLGLECPAISEGRGTAAQSQLREIGGEVAQPLLSDGNLIAILVLGPKETPYRAEDWNLLSAFGRITIVALESAAKHRTIEHLNHDLKTKVDKIAEQQRRILALQTQLHRQSAEPSAEPTGPPKSDEIAILPSAHGIVGSSHVLRQVLTLVRKVAATDAVVLLRGESGTGKELIARAVHDTSGRAGKPYVKVHCAALSANLLESELFGHVKGAFTGAHRDKVGRFELANSGTLFLDEIGDISLEVQTKLLRVLQEKTIERVGSSEPLNVDVRIIAATHQNLEELIRQGRFREDLFYRLNVFPIRVPALRERIEDIAELAMFFMQQSARRARKTIVQIDDDALALLKSFSWPGNVRQLENVIERAVVIAEEEILTVIDMPAEVFQKPEDVPFVVGNHEPTHQPLVAATVSNYRLERERFEREKIVKALGTAKGNKAEAARILGIARTTLVSRMKKLGLE